MARFSFSPGSVVAIALALLALSSMTTTTTTTTTEALKHNYYTRRDERSLIGPLGFPFGFLETGHFNLTVFDFQLAAPKKHHRHKKRNNKNMKPRNGQGHSRSLAAKADDDKCDSSKQLCLSDVLENIKGVGFLLKQFEDEASFNRYMDFIRDDPSRCIFQKYLDRKEDEILEEFDADDFTYYPGVQDVDDGYYTHFDDFSPGTFVDDEYADDDYPGRYNDGLHKKQRKTRQQQIQQQKQKHQPRRLENELSSEGRGEVIDVVEDGIYLDMLPRSNWRPNTPWVAYDFEAGQAGFYFLMYQVCHDIEEGAPEGAQDDHVYDIHSRFELDFHFSNRDMFNRVSYLSRGEMNLPWLFFAFSILYAVCLYVWYSNIQLIKEGKSGYFDIGDAPSTAAALSVSGASSEKADDGPTIYPIHYLMGFLLGLKFCSLVFESVRYHYLRVTGHSLFFSAVYYTFSFLKGVTLFTVILLIGSGWSFVKPFLSEREKNMIFGVLLLQAINNIAIVVLTQETEGEISFDRWTAVLHLVDILCCCAVLIPIVWQVNQLEKNMKVTQLKGNEDEEEEATFINNSNDRFVDDDDDQQVPESELEGTSDKDDDATTIPDERMTAKLKLFRSFYILVIAYIYVTRIVVYLFAATLNYKHTWIPIFVVELTTIFFYAAVGYMFRPMNEKSYTIIRNRMEAEPQVEMRVIDTSTKVALD